MTFNEYLKQRRIERNISIRELSRLSGVSAMHISNLESGKRGNPSPEILKKLAEGLNTPYVDLMIEAGHWSRPSQEIDEIEEALHQQEIMEQENVDIKISQYEHLTEMLNELNEDDFNLVYTMVRRLVSDNKKDYD